MIVDRKITRRAFTLAASSAAVRAAVSVTMTRGLVVGMSKCNTGAAPAVGCSV